MSLSRPWKLALTATAVAILSACSGTSLNVAPVEDLSTGDVRHHDSTPGPDGTIEVQPGDTLFRLALANHVALRDLAAWNALDANAILKPGQHLYVRSPVTPPVQAPVAPSAPPASVVQPVSPDDGGEVEVHALPLVGAAPVSAHALESDAVPPSPPPSVSAEVPAATSASGWIWPVQGKLTEKFDGLKKKGIVLSVSEDAPIHAVADGVVNYVGTFNEYGKLIIISHDNNVRSVYGYNKTLAVQSGQTVHRGDVIATAGRTAGKSAALLRFEVRLKGVPVDPLTYLPAR